jgi:c(7)-type cytochrome triheme protein
MRGIFRLFFVVALLSGSAAWAVVGGGEITFKVSGAKNAVYSHDSHVGVKKLTCSECHNALFTTRAHHFKVTMAEMRQGRSCGACHNGERAFDVKGNCDRCHTK